MLKIESSPNGFSRYNFDCLILVLISALSLLPPLIWKSNYSHAINDIMGISERIEKEKKEKERMEKVRRKHASLDSNEEIFHANFKDETEDDFNWNIFKNKD